MADGIAAQHNRGGKVNEVPTTAASTERQTSTRNQSTAIRCRKQSTRCMDENQRLPKLPLHCGRTFHEWTCTFQRFIIY